MVKQVRSLSPPSERTPFSLTQLSLVPLAESPLQYVKLLASLVDMVKYVKSRKPTMRERRRAWRRGEIIRNVPFAQPGPRIRSPPLPHSLPSISETEILSPPRKRSSIFASPTRRRLHISDTSNDSPWDAAGPSSIPILVTDSYFSPTKYSVSTSFSLQSLPNSDSSSSGEEFLRIDRNCSPKHKSDDERLRRRRRRQRLTQTEGDETGFDTPRSRKWASPGVKRRSFLRQSSRQSLTPPNSPPDDTVQYTISYTTQRDEPSATPLPFTNVPSSEDILGEYTKTVSPDESSDTSLGSTFTGQTTTTAEASGEASMTSISDPFLDIIAKGVIPVARESMDTTQDDKPTSGGLPLQGSVSQSPSLSHSPLVPASLLISPPPSLSPLVFPPLLASKDPVSPSPSKDLSSAVDLPSISCGTVPSHTGPSVDEAATSPECAGIVPPKPLIIKTRPESMNEFSLPGIPEAPIVQPAAINNTSPAIVSDSPCHGVTQTNRAALSSEVLDSVQSQKITTVIPPPRLPMVAPLRLPRTPTKVAYKDQGTSPTVPQGPLTSNIGPILNIPVVSKSSQNAKRIATPATPTLSPAPTSPATESTRSTDPVQNHPCDSDLQDNVPQSIPGSPSMAATIASMSSFRNPAQAIGNVFRSNRKVLNTISRCTPKKGKSREGLKSNRPYFAPKTAAVPVPSPSPQMIQRSVPSSPQPDIGVMDVEMQPLASDGAIGLDSGYGKVQVRDKRTSLVQGLKSFVKMVATAFLSPWRLLCKVFESAWAS